MNHLEKLKIWTKAIDLSVAIYSTTEHFPKDEKFGLTSQLRRCAVSIASNIAEGAGRNSENEFIHFLGIANGSCFELQTQIVIANRLALVSDENLAIIVEQVDELQKMNFKLQKTLRERKKDVRANVSHLKSNI